MRIESSAITMSSREYITEKHTQEETLKVWVGNERPDFEGDSSAVSTPGALFDILEISDQAKAILIQEKEVNKVNKPENPETFTLSEEDKMKIRLIEKMLEYLTGKKIKIKVMEGIKIDGTNKNCPDLPDKSAAQAPQEKQGWGLEYDYRETHFEQEKMSFSAQGIIKTADGREISFNVQLNMSREFYSENNISVRAGDAVKVDPLVINFGGNAAELTNNQFTFDLDSDGKEDQISFVGPGSGFLAIDLNSDNIINNGNELFGPNTGNGFMELARYDADGNQWIDENDPVFDRLRIWTKDSEGKDVLFALGQKGIGAIYLGSVESPFSIKNEENNLLGQVKSTGIYVSEKGSVGTIQQVDLTI